MTISSSIIKKTTLCLFGTLISNIIAVTPIQAEQKGSWEAGGMAGTLGILAEIGYRFNSTFGLRIQGGGYEYFQKNMEYDNVHYHHVRYRPITAHLLADWYFLTDWWRLTGGVGYTGTRARVKRNMANEPFPRNMMGVLTFRYSYKNKIAPYVGTGFDFYSLSCGKGASKFIFSLDLGLNFQGEVRAHVKATGPLSNSPAAMKKARHDANELLNNNWWVKCYPVASIAVRYKF